jgi:hypothetical protein
MLKTQGAIEYLEATGVKLPEPEITEEAETEVSETEVVEETEPKKQKRKS